MGKKRETTIMSYIYISMKKISIMKRLMQMKIHLENNVTINDSLMVMMITLLNDSTARDF